MSSSHNHDESLAQAYSPSVKETLMMSYKPYRAKILGVIVLGLVGRILVLGNTNLIGLWVDSLCQNSPNCRALPTMIADWNSFDFIIALSALCFVGFFLTLSFRTLFSRLSALAISQFYDEVTLRTSRFPLSFFDKTAAGRVITRFSSDYGNVFRLFGGPLAEFISILFELIAIVILLCLASPWYLIPVIIVAGLNWGIFLLNRSQLRSTRRELSASRSPSIAHFAESAQGASVIRSFQRESLFFGRFSNLDQFYLDKKRNTIIKIILFSMQMNSLSALLLLLVGVGSYMLLQWQWISLGDVGVAFSLIVMSGNTVQMFFEWLTQIEEALIGVERLDRYLRAPIENGISLPATAQFKTTHPILSKEESLHQKKKISTATSAEVEIRDLWFRYSPDGPWVLKNINLKISAGEKLGVIGRTGSGKSSLIQALFYLYPIEKGRLCVQGLQPKMNELQEGIPLIQYRQLISYISQDPTLFQGTLRMNLDMTLQLPESSLWKVLEKVGLRAWVENHPLGLDMKIEERGKNLSQGEKQLICMARILLQDAPVVVMDEATSSVDPQSEEILVRATEEFFKDRTQIIIAHRLSTLEKCDRVVWLDQGEIKSTGPVDQIVHEFRHQNISSL